MVRDNYRGVEGGRDGAGKPKRTVRDNYRAIESVIEMEIAGRTNNKGQLWRDR